MNDLPVAPGTYALHLHLAQPTSLSVGKLGEYNFPTGAYFYLGRAFGPGGLRARLGRHLRGVGKPHWHIDTLRAKTQLRSYHFVEGASGDIHQAPAPLECLWSQALANSERAFIPAPGFGSSDCHAGCPAHLVAFLVEEEPRFIQWLADFLSYHSPGFALTSHRMR
jgi:Uri superfamily endonuclease